MKIIIWHDKQNGIEFECGLAFRSDCSKPESKQLTMKRFEDYVEAYTDIGIIPQQLTVIPHV